MDGNKKTSNAKSKSNEPNIKNKEIMDNEGAIDFGNFKVLYLVTQMVGITVVILMLSWIQIHLGGFGGPSNPKQEFNWHPFLLTFGMIFLCGNSILIYRFFRQIRKRKLKLTHTALHGIALILVVIGLKTVFDSRNLNVPPITNMYSLHSWLGIGAVIIFACQWVGGFVGFLYPGIKDNLKTAMMPFHVYFGLFAFVLAIACALTGLTEKAFFSMPNDGYATLPNSGLFINVIAILLVIFGGLVVYLASEPSYKRTPLPEDTLLLRNQ